MSELHKPTIETIINTTAILLTGAGGSMAINKEWWGLVLIAFGMLLEFGKYWGRKNEFW